MQLTGFIGGSYTSRSVNVACDRSINLYPEATESGTGKNGEAAALVGTPGLALFAALGSGVGRGIYATSHGRCFAVVGTKLYELMADATSIVRGTLDSFTGPVSMADNGQQLCLVDGAHGYICTFADNTFVPIVQDVFEGGDRVAFQDGYFITNRPKTQQFYLSGLYDGLTWNALDVASKEGQPDEIVAVVSDHRELWLFGKQSTEVWFNSGDASLPFARVNGAFIEHGCAASHAAQKLDNSVFWPAADRNGWAMVMRAQGYQPQRASTHAVEQALNRAGDISKATAYTYQSGGHSFYCLSMPGVTWCYDAATNLWHERAHGRDERHIAEAHAFFGGKHLVCDYRNGNIYELRDDVYTDAGEPIIRTRVAPHQAAQGKALFYHALQLDMETGVGLESGMTPLAVLTYSDDGGHKWSNERAVSMGKIGEFKRRALWRRLGRSRDRVFRVTISDPVKVVLISAWVDAIAGAS